MTFPEDVVINIKSEQEWTFVTYIFSIVWVNDYDQAFKSYEDRVCIRISDDNTGNYASMEYYRDVCGYKVISFEQFLDTYMFKVPKIKLI